MRNIFKKIFLNSLIVFFIFSFFITKDVFSQQLYCPQGYTLNGNLCTNNLNPYLPPIQPTTTPPLVLTNNPANNGTDSTYTPIAELPGLGILDFESSCPLVDYLNTMFRLLIGLIIIIAMVKLVIGGLEYIASESISGKSNAKDSIINAFAGLVIALGSYLILNSINPTLLNLCPNLPQATIVITGPDAGDDFVDPEYSSGRRIYSQNTSVNPAIAEASEKLKDGWSISKIIITQDGKMQLEIKKGNEVQLTGKTNTAQGLNGYTSASNARQGDKKTPLGTFTLGEIRYDPGQAQFNSKGSNMGAAFWELRGPGATGRGIGIHGNKAGNLSDTNGCIRLTNADILALQPYVRTGIQVIIR
jgi:lipoprotein-anchoring transpeptidase ErfK/SrfK